MQATLELRALDRAHIETARRWRNDWRILAWTRQSDVVSDWEQERWFERQAADPTIRMYAVVVLANGHERLVGVAGLTSIDWQNRRAEFSLYIAPEHQRHGHGRTALKLLLDHGFFNLGLRQIWGETFDKNPAIKVFRDLGFKVDGTRRQFYFKDGKWLDAYLISILAEEWDALGVRNSNQRSSDKSPNSPSNSLPGATPLSGSPQRTRSRRGTEAAKIRQGAQETEAL